VSRCAGVSKQATERFPQAIRPAIERKYEDLFRASIGDINFLHRFVDLGNLRNVVAHNGVIDEPMQFRRVELAIHDWIKQVG
jgi:hypothetical protein